VFAVFQYKLGSLKSQVNRLLGAHGPEHTRNLLTGEHLQNIIALRKELKTLLTDWKQISPQYQLDGKLEPQIQEQMIKLERVRDRMKSSYAVPDIRRANTSHQRQPERSTSSVGRESRTRDREEGGRQGYRAERKELIGRSRHRASRASKNNRETRRSSSGQWSEFKQSIKRKFRPFGSWI
jgi:hypothetical protein